MTAASGTGQLNRRYTPNLWRLNKISTSVEVDLCIARN